MAGFLNSIRHEFLRHQALADGALAGLDDAAFFAQPIPNCNPIAVIVKHLSGSMNSRWTDFLTTDGEKPDRDRDAEFGLTDEDTRAQLTADWQTAWSALTTTLESLQEQDLNRTVTIRGEAHTVTQALLRGLSHATYHIGQILYVARGLSPEAPWLTIPPGKSHAPRAGYLT